VLFALFTLTDAALFRGRYIISTVVPDAAGIRRGDPVQMRGVNIGRVMGFRIVAQGVEIRLELEGEYGVPHDSRVLLHSLGPLQGMVAEIEPGTADEMIGGGDVLPGTTEAGGLAELEGLADEARTVLERTQALLSRETIANVEAGSADARRLMRELNGMAAEQRKELSELTARLRQAAAGLEQITTDVKGVTSGPELQRSVQRVDAITARLDETTASLDRSSRALESVLLRIDKGEGTLGRLTRDDTLYANLNEAALNLSRLAEDVRRQPKKYVNLSLF
jgi:phospholipid/cholesterol/gamma-HCH transport system substrate-binding protein